MNNQNNQTNIKNKTYIKTTRENLKRKIKKLNEKGKIENIDFRIVYFNDSAEIRFIRFK